MIVESGVVIRVDTGAVWVQTIRQTTCGSCRARHGCGQKLLNQFSAEAADIKAICDGDLLNRLKPGDTVDIGIAEGALVAASLLTYGIPILLLVIGAWFGSLTQSNVLSFMAAVIGLVGGALFVRWIQGRGFQAQSFEPVVLQLSSDFTPVAQR